MSLGAVVSGKLPRVAYKLVVYGPPGVGKAQPLSATVLTPHGFVPIGEICVGDEVIGANGLPTTVTGVFPQGRRPIYRVITTDGAETRCCNEHLWHTATVEESVAGKRGRARTLQQIRDTFIAKPASLTNSRVPYDCPNHRLPIVAPVQFAKSADLPLDAYLLGVFLGDGSASVEQRSVTIDKPEADLFERLAACVPLGDEARPKTGGDGVRIVVAGQRRGGRDRTVSITRQRLESLDLVGRDSFAKFIPLPYLQASVDDRLRLLRGLFDTDGHVITSGARVEYTTVSDRLCEGVIDLVRGLGGTTTVSKRVTKYRSRGVSCDGAPSWRLLAYFPNGIVPVSSVKHLARWKTDQRSYYRSIERIEPAGEEECVCIMVDAADSLYVTDDYLVTHNTTFAAGAPSPIFLPVENGTADLDVARLPAPETWADMIEAVRVLTDEPHEYRTLVVDTIDAGEALCWRDVCWRGGRVRELVRAFDGFGKGFDVAAETWMVFLKDLERLYEKRSMNIILLAHSHVKSVKNPEGEDFDGWTLRMHEKSAGLFKAWPDALLFAKVETFIKDAGTGKARGGARVLCSEGQPYYAAKNRFSLPPVFPLSWEAFEQAVREGKGKEVMADLEAEMPGLADADHAKASEAWTRADGDPVKLALLLNWVRGRVSIAAQNAAPAPTTNEGSPTT